MTLQLDLHECKDLLPDPLRIDQGRVTADDALLFELPYAAGAGRRRQPHALGQFDVAQAAFVLQQFENAQVRAVELAHGYYHYERPIALEVTTKIK